MLMMKLDFKEILMIDNFIYSNKFVVKGYNLICSYMQLDFLNI